TYETNFYEKRLFLYPSSSFSENVRIQFQNLNGRKESLDLSQSRTKSEMNLVQVWTDDKNNEIPKHLAETLDTGLRQLQISTFGDEEGDFTGIENQWNLPGDEIHITVKMKDAGNKEIRIKKISHHQNRMILVQHGDFIDHCVPEQIERLEKAAEALIEHRNVYIEKSSKSSSGLKNSEQNP
ncbi:MAG: hypothetical protein OEZ34_13875, partial [Spirochaetia bacterium]|nr:hypothetical protein [Spirochaetia bacterium]